MGQDSGKEGRDQVKEECQSSPPPAADHFTHSLSEWCKPFQDFMEAERMPTELMEYLRELICELDSPYAKYVRALKELETEMPTEDPPGAMEPPNLLPVRIRSVESFLTGKDVKDVSWVLSLVEVLNFYATMGKVKTGPAHLTPAQELMVTRLFQAVRSFPEKGGKVPPFTTTLGEIGKVKFDYGGEPVHYMEDLEASKIIPCWPKVGEAAVQDARNFVPAHVKEWLDDPASCLLPSACWPDKPPTSRVRATDREWEAIVTAGYERGMMRMVSEDELLRDHNGRPVLNGAAAVRKIKKIGGEERHLQRFISVLVPSNMYQQHMPGDDVHLPYLGQMTMMEVDEDEEVLIDSEDLTSCFNLFRLPPSWSGYAAFSKKVSARVFGGPPNEEVYVGMAVVPMGWINSVSLMQSVVRTLVFGISQVPGDSEL